MLQLLLYVVFVLMFLYENVEQVDTLPSIFLSDWFFNQDCHEQVDTGTKVHRQTGLEAQLEANGKSFLLVTGVGQLLSLRTVSEVSSPATLHLPGLVLTGAAGLCDPCLQ